MCSAGAGRGAYSLKFSRMLFGHTSDTLFSLLSPLHAWRLTLQQASSILCPFPLGLQICQSQAFFCGLGWWARGLEGEALIFHLSSRYCSFAHFLWQLTIKGEAHLRALGYQRETLWGKAQKCIFQPFKGIRNKALITQASTQAERMYVCMCRQARSSGMLLILFALMRPGQKVLLRKCIKT